MSTSVNKHTRTILCEDGVPIVATIYEPDAPDKDPATDGHHERVVLVGSATGTPQQYYGSFATFVAREARCVVVTFDFRGTGLSRPQSIKNFKASIVEWARQDFAAIVRHAEQEYRPNEICLVGNSVGVHVCALSTAEINRKVTRVLAISANNAYLGYWPWNTMYFMTLINFFLLRRISTFVCGYYPANFLWMQQLMDLPTGIINDWSWFMKHKQYFVDSKSRRLKEAQEGLQSYKGQLLSLAFVDDQFATFDSFASLFDMFTNAQSGSHLRYMNVPKDINSKIDIGHVGFFRSSVHEKTGLWQVALDYLVHGTMPKATPGSLPLRGGNSGDSHSIIRAKM